jgi:hypothetical protein
MAAAAALHREQTGKPVRGAAIVDDDLDVERIGGGKRCHDVFHLG